MSDPWWTFITAVVMFLSLVLAYLLFTGFRRIMRKTAIGLRQRRASKGNEKLRADNEQNEVALEKEQREASSSD